MEDVGASATPRPMGLSPSQRDAPRGGAKTRRFELWSRDTDLVLRDLVLRKGDTNWAKVARSIEWDTRAVTAQDCKQRWEAIKETPIKGPWSAEEDEHLKRLVMEYGSKKWNLLARAFPGRSGKQCRERWHNHVDERVKKGEWTPEEDQILCEAQRQLGNKWSEMSKILTGRSENAIKNRFNSLNAKGLTEKRANELIVKVRPKLTPEYSRRATGENSRPCGAHDHGFGDPRFQDAKQGMGRGASRHREWGGVWSGSGSDATRVDSSEGIGREGGSLALGRMKALMVAVGEERAACLGCVDSEEERRWTRGAGGKPSARGGGGRGGQWDWEVETGVAQHQNGTRLRKSNIAEAEAGMSVLAQAAGLLDVEDDGSYSDNSSGGGSAHTSMLIKAGVNCRSGGSVSSVSSAISRGGGVGGVAAACSSGGTVSGYQANQSALANQPSLPLLSYRNRPSVMDHGSTPPGSASPLPYGLFSGGNIAGHPACGGSGAGCRRGSSTYGGVMVPSAFPLGDMNTRSTAEASYGGGGGGKVSYGGGGGGAVSAMSGSGSSSTPGWYVGPGGVQRRSLESVPGPWRPYWREDDDLGIEHELAPAEPTTKRLKSKELRL